MIDRDTSGFLKHFFTAYPHRSALMVVLLAVAGLAEGVGVITLIPLLELAQGPGSESSTLGRAVVGVMAVVGLAPTLLNMLFVIVGAIAVKALLLWLAMRQVGYTVARVTRDLRLRLIRGLLRARWRYFGSQSTGRLANAVSSEAIRAAAAYREACQVFAALVIIAVYMTLSALVSVPVTIFAVVSGVALTFLLRKLFDVSRNAGREQTELTRSLASRLVDVVGGLKPVKAMAREELVWPFLEQETEGLNQAHRRQVEASEALKFFQEPSLALLLAGALYVLLGVGEQPLSAVLVLAFVFYRLMRHVNTLQMRYQVMVVGESAFWSLKEQIDRAEQEMERQPSGLRPPPLERGIEIRDLEFAYEGQPVLRGLDLDIPAGSFVAILGESGSGKTTLADLVVGLHEPAAGEILVDGVPLTDLDPRAWRKKIGYVPQDMLLFNDTIRQNVTLGDESLTDDDVERALRLAEASRFVSEHPEGLDRMVGEKGGMVSGGQRQRIAIARALVTRPSLLILDEVTTALDPGTEREICRTLGHLKGRVTILSISHQKAMTEAADVSWVMSGGRLSAMEQSASGVS